MELPVAQFRGIGDALLQTEMPYESAFKYALDVVRESKGKIKKSDMTAGIIEGAWRYGLNFSGLRVTIQFIKGENDIILIKASGGFSNAFDVTGIGDKKAKEILALIQKKPHQPRSDSKTPT